MILTKLNHLVAPLSIALIGDVEVSDADFAKTSIPVPSMAEILPMGLSARYKNLFTIFSR